MESYKIEVWCEDNYDYMKGESYSFKVAEFKDEKEALIYMKTKLDEELQKLTKNAKNEEDLIHIYKYGGSDYFIKGKSSLIFSSWDYVEQEAQRIFKDGKY